MNYRPICDTWILARSKVKYYGAYPAGFLHRARHLLGAPIDAPVLHVCSGKIKEYPFRGLGKQDLTLDLDPACVPDFLQDARDPFPKWPVVGRLPHTIEYYTAKWAGIMIDRPYSEADADHYVPGRTKLPTANQLVRNAIDVLPIGGRVGILDYVWPQPPKNAREMAVVTVVTGRNNRARLYTVFERME
jgi:hypothetical protein